MRESSACLDLSQEFSRHLPPCVWSCVRGAQKAFCRNVLVVIGVTRGAHAMPCVCTTIKQHLSAFVEEHLLMVITMPRRSAQKHRVHLQNQDCSSRICVIGHQASIRPRFKTLTPNCTNGQLKIPPSKHGNVWEYQIRARKSLEPAMQRRTTIFGQRRNLKHGSNSISAARSAIE